MPCSADSGFARFPASRWLDPPRHLSLFPDAGTPKRRHAACLGLARMSHQADPDFRICLSKQRTGFLPAPCRIDRLSYSERSDAGPAGAQGRRPAAILVRNAG